MAGTTVLETKAAPQSNARLAATPVGLAGARDGCRLMLWFIRENTVALVVCDVLVAASIAAALIAIYRFS
jgi:hypothetical protein